MAQDLIHCIRERSDRPTRSAVPTPGQALRVTGASACPPEPDIASVCTNSRRLARRSAARAGLQAEEPRHD